MFFIAGIRIEPRAATSATAEPLISAKKSEALIDTIARPPRTKPTIAEANATSLRLIPDAFIIAPAKIKSGIAISGNDVAPLNITNPTLGIDPTPPGPVIIARTETRPKEIAIGIPIRTSTSNTTPIPRSLIGPPRRLGSRHLGMPLRVPRRGAS